MNSVTVNYSSLQGKGVFALKDFHEGELILEIDDSHIVNDESSLTKHQHEFDCDYLANGRVVLMQVPEKYINHSCDPSSYVKTVKGVRKVFAMRELAKGEEITFDYVINSDNDGSFICNCRSPHCRNVYAGKFFNLPRDVQLRYLPYLEDWFKAEHLIELEQQMK